MFNKLLMIVMIFVFLTFNAESQEPPKKCESTETSYNLPCMKHELKLVDKKILIKVYTKPKPGKIIDRTFVVVHANEEKGLDAVKRVISENYGRLVEVVSNFSGTSTNPDDNKRRFLYFGANHEFCIDPNRIYTKKGIKENLKSDKNLCRDANPGTDSGDLIFGFGEEFLKILTDKNKYKFIIGIHNNDSSSSGLTLNYYSGGGEEADTAVGIFTANNHIENKSVDIDDFILVSDIDLFLQLSKLGKSFNIALQENRKYILDNPEIDDGSMSIYFGKKMFGAPRKLPFFYMNIEAEGKANKEGKQKDRQMEAIRLAITQINKPR